jgi:hypothetical protein
MDNFGWHIRSLILPFFEFLLKLYPPRFRHEFSSEIQEIVLSRVRSAEERGWMAWLSAVLQEIMGLVPSIIQERWHELSFQKERVMATEPQLQKVSFVKTMAYIRWADPPLWRATLADLIPLWLLSFIFLPHPVSWKMAGISFVLYIVAIILLLWIRWFTPELILYTFFPILPIWIFDEMSASYEIAFVLLCTLVLSIGIFAYRLSLHKDYIGLGWLILLVVFIGTWMLASHANQNYWQMFSDLGYTCGPDWQPCTSLTGNETPPWVLFFSP